MSDLHQPLSVANSLRAAADYLDGWPLKTIALRYSIPTVQHVERLARRFGLPKRTQLYGLVKQQQRVLKANRIRAEHIAARHGAQ